MGTLIILVFLALYIFIFVKSFYTKASEIRSVDYFKLANFNGRIILYISIVVLVAVLLIHGGVYWGFALFTSLFSVLGFLAHVPMDERIETYLEHVAMISIVVMMPLTL